MLRRDAVVGDGGDGLMSDICPSGTGVVVAIMLGFMCTIAVGAWELFKWVFF